MYFCDLPVELLVLVLDALDVPTMLLCRQLCSLFNRIIQEASLLQYKVELNINGAEDGPPSNIPSSTRLEVLRNRREAWGTLRHRAKRILPVQPFDGLWQLSGGVFVLADGRGRLDLMRLPSLFKGIEEVSWSADDLRVEILREICMDPSQDLLGLLEQRESGFRIHLRSLTTTCNNHPRARHPIIPILSGNFPSHGVVIQVFGDLVGLSLASRQFGHPTGNRLLVVNWKLGKIELDMHCGTTIFGFTLITKRHVLVAHVKLAHGYQLSLSVLDIKRNQAGNSHLSISNAVWECEFFYPRLVHKAVAYDAFVTMAPSPFWKPDLNLKVPFHANSEDRLLAITLNLFSIYPWVNATHALIVPLSTILHHLYESNMSQRTILWQTWGPGRARFISSPLPCGTPCVYGMSFVHIHDHKIRMFHFGQADVRKDIAETGGEQTPVDPAVGKIFSGNVSEPLPSRIGELPLSDDDIQGLATVMIDEDSIILAYDTAAKMQPESTVGVQYHVWSF